MLCTMVRIIMKKLSLNPKQIFLIDGLGAVLTAILLGVILKSLYLYFGIPKNILNFLSLIACVFAVYSLSCYFFVQKKWRLFLKIIIFFNLLYCMFSTILVFYYYGFLTLLGIIYFVIELLIIACLVLIELKLLNESNEDVL